MAFRRHEDIFEHPFEPEDLTFTDTGFVPLQPAQLSQPVRHDHSALMHPAIRVSGAQRRFGAPHDQGLAKHGYLDPFTGAPDELPPRYSRVSVGPPGFDWEPEPDLDYPPRGLREHGYSFELGPDRIDWAARQTEGGLSPDEGYGSQNYVSFPGGRSGSADMINGPGSPGRMSRMLSRMTLGGRGQRSSYEDAELGYGPRDPFDDPSNSTTSRRPPLRRRSFDWSSFGRGSRADHYDDRDSPPPRRCRRRASFLSSRRPYG